MVRLLGQQAHALLWVGCAHLSTRSADRTASPPEASPAGVGDVEVEPDRAETFPLEAAEEKGRRRREERPVAPRALSRHLGLKGRQQESLEEGQG